MSSLEPRLTPYHWWGDAWSKPNPQSIENFVEGGLINRSESDYLTATISSGHSVVVVGSESGVGKSTLAYSLISLIPRDRLPVYIRGAHEQFAWERKFEPGRITLLVNEISDHLPVYVWGEALERSVSLMARGAQLVATAHPSGLRRLRELVATNATEIIPVTVIDLDPHAQISDIRPDSTRGPIETCATSLPV